MTALLTLGRIVMAVLALFVSIYILVIYIVIDKDRTYSQRQFSTHAAVITEDVWAFDTSGVSSYLELAVKANHYKTLIVTEPEGEILAEAHSAKLDGVAEVLHRAGFIGVRALQHDLYHEDRKIGTLRGEQYVRVVFSLLNILVFLLFLCLALVFMLYLVSNRRQLELTVLERTQNLHDSEKRFHDLVNLLPEMVWESDNEGHIMYANRLAISRFGLLEPQLNKPSWFNFIVPQQQSQARRYYQSCIQGQDKGLKEFSALDKEGKEFPVLIRSAVMQHKNKVVGARSIIIDISDRQSLEKELQRAQKMKAIGIMAGGVAHDLNNILSGVVSYPELMLMKLPPKSELRGLVEATRQSGIRAAEVVSDLLTVARGIAATKQVHSMNALIADFCQSPEFMQLKKDYPNILFTTDLSPSARNIFCSPIHIRKCLMNLTANGAEAISGDGQVTICSGSLQYPALPDERNGAEGRNYTIVTVKDTGQGLSDNDVGHIFEPFYTKKKMGRSGTGLGLTVVWNTMVDHDGWVDVNSYESQTIFTLYFPSTTEKLPEQPLELDWQQFKGTNQSVLVIDDEERQRDIAEKLLHTLEYKVKCVTSGEDALALLEQEPLDVLLLDMLMEPGMNGLETYKRICAINPRQNAVIASGFSKSTEVQEALRLGANAFIAKPYTIEQLGQALAKTLIRQ
jgi:two-component system, cell cycle sensor histidine kinase and response regulator CckA